LTIAEVTPEMAGKKNILSLTNEYGTTEYEFVLELGDKPPAGEQLQKKISFYRAPKISMSSMGLVGYSWSSHLSTLSCMAVHIQFSYFVKKLRKHNFS
jgi:hypothetical protein